MHLASVVGNTFTYIGGIKRFPVCQIAEAGQTQDCSHPIIQKELNVDQ